jgi:hypothetical protein
MALTKVSTGMIEAGTASVDLDIDSGTLYIDVTNGRVGVSNSSPATALDVTGTATATLFSGSGASLTNIPNVALDNSSITINSYNTALGGTVTLSTSDVGEGTNLYYTDARADARVSLIVDAAPETLNTLNELAAALGDDANFSTTVTNSIATKLPLAGGSLTGNLLMRNGGNIELGGYNSGNDKGLILTPQDGSGYWHVYNTAGGHLAFGASNTIGSSEKMRIAGSGNVGIGTDTPDEKLVVEGDGARIYVNSADYHIAMIGRRGSSGVSLDQGYLRLKDQGTNTVVLDTAGVSYLNGGNFGIGTTSPASTLDLTNGTDTAERAIRIQNDTVTLYTGVEGSAGNRFVGSAVGNAFFGTTSAHGLELGTNNNVRMVIDSAGNVGIGTTGPNEALEVKGSIRIDNGASFTAYQVYRDNIQYGVVGGGGNQFTIQASNNKNINLFDDSGVGLTVKDGGNVGIGTNAPQAKLHVNEGPVYIGDYTGTVTPTEGIFLENAAGNSNTIAMYTYNASVFKIESDGLEANIGWGSSADREVNFVNTGAGDIKVGIGTDIPAVSLHVYNATQGRVAIENASRRFDLSADADGLGFRDQTAAVTRMVLTTAGNVGIGTTDQIGEKLTVNGSVQVLGNNDPNYSAKFISGYDATHGLRITTRLNDVTESEVLGVFADTGGASPRLVLNPTNGWNLGIGTTSPAGKLNIQYDMDVNTGGVTTLTAGTSQYGSINFSGVTAQAAGASSTTMQGLTWQVNNYEGTTNYGVQAQLVVGNNGSAGTFMGFFTSDNYSSAPVERFRIEADGKVGIGTNNPVGNLHIVGGDGLNGSSTIGIASNEFIIENNSDAGMTIRSGADAGGVISFADPDDHNTGQIYYSHDTDKET